MLIQETQSRIMWLIWIWKASLKETFFPQSQESSAGRESFYKRISLVHVCLLIFSVITLIALIAGLGFYSECEQGWVHHQSCTTQLTTKRDSTVLSGLALWHSGCVCVRECVCIEVPRMWVRVPPRTQSSGLITDSIPQAVSQSVTSHLQQNS